MQNLGNIEIKSATRQEDCLELYEKGYLPIDCTFYRGRKKLHVDPLGLNFANTGRLPSECIGEQQTKKFIVTGSARDYVTFTIACLAGLKLPKDVFKEINAALSIKYFSKDKLPPKEYGRLLVGYQEIVKPRDLLEDFYRGVRYWSSAPFLKQTEAGELFLSLLDILWENKNDLMLESKSKLEAAKRSNRVSNSIAFIESDVCEYNCWYTQVPVVVVYRGLERQTVVGVKDRDTAFRLFGQSLVTWIRDNTEHSWNGRAQVCSSKKGESSWTEAFELYRTIKVYLGD